MTTHKSSKSTNNQWVCFTVSARNHAEQAAATLQRRKTRRLPPLLHVVWLYPPALPTIRHKWWKYQLQVWVSKDGRRVLTSSVHTQTQRQTFSFVMFASSMSFKGFYPLFLFKFSPLCFWCGGGGFCYSELFGCQAWETNVKLQYFGHFFCSFAVTHMPEMALW